MQHHTRRLLGCAAVALLLAACVPPRAVVVMDGQEHAVPQEIADAVTVARVTMVTAREALAFLTPRVARGEIPVPVLERATDVVELGLKPSVETLRDAVKDYIATPDAMIEQRILALVTTLQGKLAEVLTLAMQYGYLDAGATP